jgi:hypothetical protein
MSRNVTLRLADGILKEAKRSALEADKSLSQWVADLIAGSVTREQAYRQARDRALKRMENPPSLGGGHFTREELHERTSLL